MASLLDPLFGVSDGCLDGARLRELSAQLGISEEDTDAILEDLDQDGVGKISLQDFARGFSEFLLTSSLPLDKGRVREDRRDDVTKKSGLEAEDSTLGDRVQKERARMKHERHFQTPEEGSKNRTLQMKNKADEEEEMRSFGRKMTIETETLRCHVALIEKMQTRLKLHHHHREHQKLSEAREKLERTFVENRRLRLALLDTQTNVALVHGELKQLKVIYAEKCHELQKERENILEVLHEHEILTQQLNESCFVDGKLQDPSNVWRAADRAGAIPLPRYRKRGSIVGDYVMPNGRMHHVACEECFHFNATKDDDDDEFRKTTVRSSSSLEGDDRDSGTFTLRDDDDDEDDATVPRSGVIIPSDTGEEETLQGMASKREISSSEGREEEKSNSEDQMKISSDTAIHEEQDRLPPIGDLHWRQKESPRRSRRRRGRSNPLASEEDSSVFDPQDVGPHRTYKVVFVGDAAVGKSSFILFICRGVFVQHLNSTLGIDFCMKTLKVGEENVAVQLWDTAGQERFRSITQSYFRKVDGVMLLYDCTNERSFLDVRRWIEAIKESTVRKFPIALIGNKWDEKRQAEASGRNVVRRSDGERLAKEVGALFSEASAKDGMNVLESLTQLIRLMASNEDQEIHSCAVCLQSSPKKSSRCCN